MKKVIIIICFIIFTQNCCYATQEEIISSQKDDLNISTFIKEAKEYTSDIFPDIDMNDLLSDAIKGEINNEKIFGNILNLFGKEILSPHIGQLKPNLFNSFTDLVFSNPQFGHFKSKIISDFKVTLFPSSLFFKKIVKSGLNVFKQLVISTLCPVQYGQCIPLNKKLGFA